MKVWPELFGLRGHGGNDVAFHCEKETAFQTNQRLFEKESKESEVWHRPDEALNL